MQKKKDGKQINYAEAIEFIKKNNCQVSKQ